MDPGEPRVQLLDDGVEERIVAARNVVRGGVEGGEVRWLFCRLDPNVS